MNLTQVPIPSQVRVVEIKGVHEVRLLEMGITPGQTLRVIRSAPTGYPIEIQVRGYAISLRREEAEAVMVELS